MKYVIVVLALLAGFMAGVTYRNYSLDYACQTTGIIYTPYNKWHCELPRIKGKSWPSPYIKNREQYDWSSWPNEV